MSETLSLSWLHKDVQASILSVVAGGRDDAVFTVRSEPAIAEIHALSASSESPVFEIVGQDTTPLRFRFTSEFTNSCFSREMLEGAAVGPDFKPSRHWGKLHKRAKIEILKALLMDGRNYFPDSSALQHIIGTEYAVDELFSKGVLIPVADSQHGCEVSGILVEYLLSRSGLLPKDVHHRLPVDRISHPDICLEMILRDCEYIAGSFRSFREDEWGADRSENVINHLIFWTSIWAFESSAAKFASLIPHGDVAAWGTKKELVASRHAVKFLSDKNPVLSEIRSIIVAWSAINDSFPVLFFSPVFFNGKLLTTTHTEDFLIGVRHEEGGDPRKSPDYPHREVTDYAIRILEHHQRSLPPLVSEESFIRSTNWDGITTYPYTSIEISHSRAFKGVLDLSTTSLLISCQAIMNYVADIIPLDKRPVSEWITFKQQYLIVHSLRRTLRSLVSEDYVTNSAKKRIGKILEAGFVTDRCMRNDLVHYEISGWNPDKSQDDFGMSQHYHQRSYAELRMIMQNEATRLSGEMNKWGIQERYAGLPLVSSWFKKKNPNLLERVLRRVATDPIDKIPFGRLGEDTP